MKNFNEILKEGRPVLVDFFATWCGPCREMHKVLEEVKSAMGERARIVTLDIDEAANRRLTAEYNIRSVPTLIIFSNGVQRWRQSGVVSSKKLISMLEEYREERIPEKTE